MKPSLVILLTASPVVLLLQVVAILFGLYVYPTVGGGLTFFTVASFVLALFVWHDHALWPLQQRMPKRAISFVIGGVFGVVVQLTTAHAFDSVGWVIGTMVYVGTGLLGAYCGHFIGSRLVSVSL